MEDERLSNLEKDVKALQDQGQKTHDLVAKLQDSINQLILASGNNPPPPPPPDKPDTKAPDPEPKKAAASKAQLKPATPPSFNGDRTRGKAFLFACRTYIRLCPDSFLNKEQKIVWAMSFMNAGRAKNWARGVFQTEDDNGFPFATWAAFETKFKRLFTPVNSEMNAINILEGESYFQKNRTVDDYLDTFRDLIRDSKYSDDKTIVVKFRRGLDRKIANQIATMAGGAPAMNDPESWYSMAIQLDQAHTTNKAFQNSSRSTTAPPKSGHTASAGLLRAPASTTRTPSAPAPPPRYAHATPTPGNPVPMDIDAARKRAALPPTCHRCSQVGHFKKDCPYVHDVRLMSADELQDQLESLLARKDVERGTAHAPEVESEEGNGDAGDDEDFASRSG